MDEPRNPADERALDPDEQWGQGTDPSHPDSATGQELDTARQVRDVPSGEDSPPGRGAGEVADGLERAAREPDWGREGN